MSRHRVSTYDYSNGSRLYVQRGPGLKEITKAIASVPKDTRGLTARVLGDPLPGRSALDRRQR